MALTKDQKKAQIEQLRERIKDAKSLVFVSYRGLSVSETSALRAKLREKNAEMKVAKKTLYALAAKEEGYPEVAEEILDGPVGFVFSFDDEVTGAKTSFEFSKQNDAVQILGGVLNGKVLSKVEANELAKIKSKEELLAQVIGLFCAPMSNFASMANSPLTGFARALKELSEKGGVGEAAAVVASTQEEVAEAEETKEVSEAEEAQKDEEPIADDATDEQAQEETEEKAE